MNSFSIKKKYWYQRNGLLQCSPLVAWSCAGFMTWNWIRSKCRWWRVGAMSKAAALPHPDSSELLPWWELQPGRHEHRDSGNSESSFSGFVSSMKPTINQNIEQNRKGKWGNRKRNVTTIRYISVQLFDHPLCGSKDSGIIAFGFQCLCNERGDLTSFPLSVT